MENNQTKLQFNANITKVTSESPSPLYIYILAIMPILVTGFILVGMWWLRYHKRLHSALRAMTKQSDDVQEVNNNKTSKYNHVFA